MLIESHDELNNQNFSAKSETKDLSKRIQFAVSKDKKLMAELAEYKEKVAELK